MRSEKDRIIAMNKHEYVVQTNQSSSFTCNLKRIRKKKLTVSPFCAQTRLVCIRVTTAATTEGIEQES